MQEKEGNKLRYEIVQNRTGKKRQERKWKRTIIKTGEIMLEIKTKGKVREREMWKTSITILFFEITTKNSNEREIKNVKKLNNSLKSEEYERGGAGMLILNK